MDGGTQRQSRTCTRVDRSNDRRRGGSVDRGRLRANCPSIDVVPSRLNHSETFRVSRLMPRRTIRERDERWRRRRDWRLRC